jgi:hypothetical protein
MEQYYFYSTAASSPTFHNQSLTTLSLRPFPLAVLINTCSIVGKFLNDEVHLPDEEADKLQSRHVHSVPCIICPFQYFLMQPLRRYCVKSPVFSKTRQSLGDP